MYAAPPVLSTEIYATLPKGLHRTGQPSSWVTQRGGGPLHSFLEGPAFDRHGNLYCTDIPYGRIFRISPNGDWDVFADYDGEPNGLKIHRDGRIFVADRKRGLLCFDPKTVAMEVVLSGPGNQAFKGLNDLTFAATGDLYFTDQGDSALEDPSGCVYRLRSTGELDLLFKGLAGPNGLALNAQESVLYVAVTRANQIVSMPLRPNYGGVAKCGVFIQLSGSPTGPDGMALDEEGNLAIVHAGFGTVWLFSRFGEPLYRIKSCAGIRTTNVTYGGPDRKMLFVTEAEHGAILQARLPYAGKLTYSHSP